MSYFAALLARRAGHWKGEEVSLDACESIEDIADVAREEPGDVRLLVIEQDDQYAVVLRVAADDEFRVFLSDGHAADEYPLAAIVAEELVEIGGDELAEDNDAPPAHDSAPFGDAGVVDDLGLSGVEMLELAGRVGELPIDLISAVCERVGCGEVFEALRE